MAFTDTENIPNEQENRERVSSFEDPTTPRLKEDVKTYRERITGVLKGRAEEAKQYGESLLSDFVSEAMDRSKLSAEELAKTLQEKGPEAAFAEARGKVDRVLNQATQTIDTIFGESADQKSATVISEPTPVENESDVETIRTPEAIREKYSGNRADIAQASFFRSAASNGADFIPFIGGAKMSIEALAGTKADGTQLQGTERLVHFGVGAGSVALDFFTAGTGSLAVKGGIKVGEKVAAKALLKQGAKRLAGEAGELLAKKITQEGGEKAAHQAAVNGTRLLGERLAARVAEKGGSPAAANIAKKTSEWIAKNPEKFSTYYQKVEKIARKKVNEYKREPYVSPQEQKPNQPA